MNAGRGVPFRVEGLDHVALSVRDQQASAQWFTEVLGLQRAHAEAWGDTPVALMAGGSGLALFANDSDAATAAISHIAFRVDRENFEAAQARLRSRGIAFELANHDVAHSIYFKDPNGFDLELTTYEV